MPDSSAGPEATIAPRLMDAPNKTTAISSSVLALNEMPDDYVETYREKVRSLTPPDLLATARKYFDSANMQIVVVGDRAQIEEQAKATRNLDGDERRHKKRRDWKTDGGQNCR